VVRTKNRGGVHVPGKDVPEGGVNVPDSVRSCTVTADGRLRVTAAVSLPEPETVIWLAVPAMVAT
jgi:hypothetical protein